MATRSERDKSKSQQEKHQQILAKLLKEEDNKYCVDCDAKGPRWASWNLGVFLCIRCAGIHRNLGVHISKVKSVNLDTWTQEQLAMVQEMGNSRARAVYEANLPDHFRRPQTDSTLEAFVRAKYEQKKYIAKDWVPPQPKVQPVVVEKEKRKARPRQTNTNIQLSGPSKSVATNRPEAKATVNDVTAAPMPPKTEPVKKKESNIDDLIGLDSSVSAPAATSNDLFSDFIGADPALESQPSGQAGSASNGLEPSLFGNSGGNGEEKKSTKDSIMALYGSGNNQQNFGVPGGMYMPTQQQVPQQQQQPMMQNGMMPNMMGQQASMGMMGMAPGASPMMAQGMQPQVMMGQMAAMPAMQSGNMMGGAAMSGMGQAGYSMGQQGYNMGQQGYSMGATGMYNMAAQQPAASQQFQQLANQMAGMSMGGQAMGTYQQPNGIAAGGATWGAPQPGQTLSTNLWQ